VCVCYVPPPPACLNLNGVHMFVCVLCVCIFVCALLCLHVCVICVFLYYGRGFV